MVSFNEFIAYFDFQTIAGVSTLAIWIIVSYKIGLKEIKKHGK